MFKTMWWSHRYVVAMGRAICLSARREDSIVNIVTYDNMQKHLHDVYWEHEPFYDWYGCRP